MIATETQQKGKNAKCFNCDSLLHVSRDCPEPKDPVKSKKNRDAHTAAKLADCCPMGPKWHPLEPGENGKCVIDNKHHTRNTVTNRWVQDAAPPSGLVTPANDLPPAQPAWQTTAPTAPSPPSSSDADVGGALLAGVHGNIGSRYSPMRFQGQPSPSQLAAVNANAAVASAATKDARKDGIRQQMIALELEHTNLA